MSGDYPTTPVMISILQCPKLDILVCMSACAGDQAVFARVDRNQDGRISRAELIKALRADAELQNLLRLPRHVHESDRDAFERVFQGILYSDQSKSSLYRRIVKVRSELT